MRDQGIPFGSHNYLWPGATLTAQESARLLGISLSRFRQLAGTRAAPDPILGAPEKEHGVRGAAWHLEAVLRTALVRGYGSAESIPPLLPHPSEVRYQPAFEQGARRIVTIARGQRSHQVWAELYRPRGHGAAYDLLVVTALDDDWFVTPEDDAAIAQEFFGALPGSQSTRHLAVVHIPVAGKLYYVPNLVRVAVLHRDLFTSDGRNAPMPRWYNVPAQDVAACLGWDAIPVWPASCITAANVSMWAPGHPVPVVVPAATQALWNAALMVPTYRDAAPTELLRESYRTLEKELYNAVDQQRDDVRGELPDGTALAITLEPLPVPDDLRYGEKTSFFAAVSHITSTPGVPALVADAILTYFGDWGYSFPKTLHLQHLPDRWQAGFATLRRDAIALTDEEVSTARARRLQAHALPAVPAHPPMLARVGRQYVAFNPDYVTVLAWNGYDDTTDDGALADAWPAMVSELLIARDPGTSSLVAWALTADGAVHPLPTSQALRDFPSLAREALTGETSSKPRNPRLEALLSSITPETSRTLNYAEAVSLLTDQS
ncbi:hypothetical protein [Curtobacterium sp. UNCCL17]|uniref:hypothetical protein n=1 Tax=Curtobacterium sp. UNCCL17 TaxID=1449051 RepID=UPI0004886903|nr:hypothetical protein [Curtobacterium sp. UNCCL17]